LGDEPGGDKETDDDDLDLAGFDDDLGLGDEPGGDKETEDDDLDLADKKDTAEMGAEESDDFGGFGDLGLDDEFGEDDDFGNLIEEAGKGRSAAGASGDGEEDEFAGLGLDEDDFEIPDEDDLAEPVTELGSAKDDQLEKAAEDILGDDFEEEEDLGFLDEDIEPDSFAADFTVPARKRGRSLLWIFVFFFLVLAAVGSLFLFAPRTLDPLLAPLGLGSVELQESKDDPMGNRYISPEDAKHFFRQNRNEGQLLVITGLARNHYPTPRSFIKLKGLLHNNAGQVLAQKQVYCGNVLTEQQLSELTMEDMQKILNLRSGANGSNESIPSGESVKFMIVFNEIPNDLAEYTVEVYSSEPVKQ
jgi:hypothetical protein